MPDMAPASAPGGQQPGGQQPPMGASPMTGPTPNKGYEAAAAQKLAFLKKTMEEIVALSGASSEMGMAVHDCLKKLGKFMQPGAGTPASEKNELESRFLKNQQNAGQIQQMRQMMAQQGQQGTPTA